MSGTGGPAGADALADGLEHAGCQLSPEARAAVLTLRAVPDLLEAIDRCGSGRELAAMGFPEEVGTAAALDADDHASVLDGGMFVRA
jgi:2-phosphosulfolactate phosphatase